ncbi:MAG: iron ABC transporter permease [Proteobacteria bacterium]|nr:iron ABC transporter permease [Pseudomonadota bacterium]
MERLVSKRQLELNSKKIYLNLIGKKLLVGLFLAFSLSIIFFYSLKVGSINISFKEILSTLLFEEKSEYRHVIWDIRFTRSVGAIIAGAGLGVAGVIMQNVLRNPLASPFTIGVSQGAAFGAAFAIIILGAGQTHITGNEMVTVNNPYLVTISAFIFSLLSVVFILMLSSLKNITKESIILAGVALSSFFGAGTMFLQYFASDFQVSATVFWTFGDLGKANWYYNKIMFLAFMIPFVYFLIVRWDYNAIQWGDESAKSLGVNVERLRVISMLLSSLIVAVITSFLGIIGFIGLIAPHIMRFLVGNDYRFLIPYSALAGSFLLLLSDIVAREVLKPVVLPVGIITSFAGAFLFLYLLIFKRGF